MNDMAYLQSISADVAPAKPASSSLLGGLNFRKVGIFAGVALFIIILLAVLSAALPSKATLSDDLSRIYLRSDALLTSLQAYTPYVKDSTLRAHGADLSTSLTELKAASESALSASGAKPDASALPAEDTALIDSLNANLEKARLNGILDRHYALEFDYQIRYLLLLEDSALQKSDNSALSASLSSSYRSLETLRLTFSSFSESK